MGPSIVGPSESPSSLLVAPCSLLLVFTQQPHVIRLVYICITSPFSTRQVRSATAEVAHHKCRRSRMLLKTYRSARRIPHKILGASSCSPASKKMSSAPPRPCCGLWSPPRAPLCHSALREIPLVQPGCSSRQLVELEFGTASMSVSMSICALQSRKW
jgi:hypothetical protein